MHINYNLELNQIFHICQEASFSEFLSIWVVHYEYAQYGLGELWITRE